MKIYNSLTRQSEAVQPLDGQTVRLYSCGPTVYDHAHIGNLAAYIFADTLRRSLQTSGQNVRHVMNYTDVDDKTIRRSQENYPDLEPRQALSKLTEQYIELFRQDMTAIGNNLDDLHFMKATEAITGIQKLIEQLLAANFAYVADDGVYFSIEAYQKSGKTYGQLLNITANNTGAARIQNDEYDKASVHDFALWKKQKPGEPAWEFNLDGHNLTGRPGWHIECSVMSQAGLGQPFDIHTGGVDLIFPHHENEIAQSTALTKNPTMAKFFAHNNHVLVDGKKMSKSAHNFYTLKDITSKGYDPLAFRLMILQTHYRGQSHFSWENLTAAQNRLQNWRAVADLRWQTNQQATKQTGSLANDDLANCLDNDLDTPAALAVIDRQLDAFQNGLHPDDQTKFISFLELIDAYLGLQLSVRPNAAAADSIKKLLEERQIARDNQDWTKADQLRGELEKNGLQIKDTPQGQIWAKL